MTSAIKRWFQDIIIERAKRLLWANVAAELEADAVLDYVAQVARIEEQADAYEAEGKSHLAALLRERAGQISFENPAGAGERVGQAFAERKTEFPRLPQQSAAPAGDGSPEKPRRGRPPKLSSGPGQIAPSENGNVDTQHSGRNDREGTSL